MSITFDCERKFGRLLPELNCLCRVAEERSVPPQQTQSVFVIVGDFGWMILARGAEDEKFSRIRGSG